MIFNQMEKQKYKQSVKSGLKRRVYCNLLIKYNTNNKQKKIKNFNTFFDAGASIFAFLLPAGAIYVQYHNKLAGLLLILSKNDILISYIGCKCRLTFPVQCKRCCFQTQIKKEKEKTSSGSACDGPDGLISEPTTEFAISYCFYRLCFLFGFLYLLSTVVEKIRSK